MFRQFDPSLKLSLATVLASLFFTQAHACPELSGEWQCYEPTMDYRYTELIQQKNENGIFHYDQVMKVDSYETPSPEKITDSVERQIDHIIVENNDWFFFHKSFCPTPNSLQTQETVVRKEGEKILGRSSADFILILNADLTLDMVTNSVDEDGTVYNKEFVGHCKKSSTIR